MGWKLHGKISTPRSAGLQSARAHAKCTGPRKVRRLRYECAGRQVGGRERNAWATVQLHGPHWVRGPQLCGEVSGPHCHSTCHAMPAQCNRVGHDEPQSPGTLRVNNALIIVEVPSLRSSKKPCNKDTDLQVWYVIRRFRLSTYTCWQFILSFND